MDLNQPKVEAQESVARKGAGTPGVDRSLETLFSGLNNVANTTGQVVSGVVTNQINEEVQRSSDIDDFNFLNSQGLPVPSEVENAVSRLRRAQTANSQGKLGSSALESRISSTARTLRAKFPGFRDEIDKSISQVTGRSPANALRKSLQKRIEREQNFQLDLKEDATKQSIRHLNQGEISQAQYDGFGGDPTKVNRFVAEKRRAESLAKAEQEELKARNAREDRNEKQSKADTQELFIIQARRKVSEAVGGIVQGVSGEVGDNTGASESAFISALQDLGTEISPEDANQIRALGGQIKQQVVLALGQLSDNEAFRGIDFKTVRDLEAEASKRVDNLIDLAINPETGSLKLELLRIKNEREKEVQQLYEKYPLLRRIEIINDKLGGGAAEKFIDNNKDFLLGKGQLLGADIVASISAGQEIENFGGLINDLNRVADDSGKTARRVFEDLSGDLSDPKTSVKSLEAIAKTLFGGQGPSAFVDTATQHKAFVTLFNPAVQKNIQRLSPELQEKFREQTVITGRQAIRSVISSAPPRIRTFQIDPETLTLSNLDTDTTDQFSDSPFGQLETSSVTAFANRINSTVERILEIHDNDPSIRELLTEELNNFVSTKLPQERPESRRERAESNPKAGQNPFGVEALKFEDSSASKIDNGLKDSLAKAAENLGISSLKIKSGFRDAERNARAGGAKLSAHQSGKAVDISVVPFNDGEREELVRELMAQGVKRFIMYSGNTSLHADLGSTGIRDGRKQHFMFDRSADNLGRAPDWFKRLAREAGHVFKDE